jgi:hypothetical protein
LREWSLSRWPISTIARVYTPSWWPILAIEGVITHSMADISHQECMHPSNGQWKPLRGYINPLNGQYWPSRRWSLTQWLILDIKGVWNVVEILKWRSWEKKGQKKWGTILGTGLWTEKERTNDFIHCK